MAKRLTEKQKSEIADILKMVKLLKLYLKEFNCTTLTITRNLKKNLGEIIYKELVEKNKNVDKFNTFLEKDKKKNKDFELANERFIKMNLVMINL